MKTYEQQYLATVEDLLENGERASNRTGVDTLFKLGLYLEINMEGEFPLLTTKKVNWRSAFAEMLGFIRGYDNAADFRALGTKVWDQNANENKEWLANPNRRGIDHLNRVYGVQWRDWRSTDGRSFDQFKQTYNDLLIGTDNRREVITAWNPGELDKMALPPCHMTMQFGRREIPKQIYNQQDIIYPKEEATLDLFLYIRSNDMGLGNPYNVAQYAWLLHLMAQITGHKPGKLMIFAFNYHIYVNHIDALKEQLSREPKKPPTLTLHPRCSDLKFLDQTTIPIEEWTFINDYDPHPFIKMDMAV